MSFFLQMKQEPSDVSKELSEFTRGEPRGLGLPNVSQWYVRDILILSGVVDPDADPLWPEVDPEIMDDFRVSELSDYLDADPDKRDAMELEDGPPTEAELAELKRYEEQVREVRFARSPDPNKVPPDKFNTCDHWQVWPEEASLISKSLTDFVDAFLAHPTTFFDRFSDAPPAVLANVKRRLDFDGRGDPEYVLGQEIHFLRMIAEWNRRAAEVGGYEVGP